MTIQLQNLYKAIDTESELLNYEDKDDNTIIEDDKEENYSKEKPIKRKKSRVFYNKNDYLKQNNNTCSY